MIPRLEKSFESAFSVSTTSKTANYPDKQNPISSCRIELKLNANEHHSDLISDPRWSRRCIHGDLLINKARKAILKALPSAITTDDRWSLSGDSIKSISTLNYTTLKMLFNTRKKRKINTRGALYLWRQQHGLTALTLLQGTRYRFCCWHRPPEEFVPIIIGMYYLCSMSRLFSPIKANL